MSENSQNTQFDFASNISSIYCRISKKENLPCDINSIPHEKIRGAFLTYFVNIKSSDGETQSVVINNSVLNDWSINKRQLKAIAWCNTRRDNPDVALPVIDNR